MGISINTFNLLSNPKFDGAGHVNKILIFFRTMKHIDYSSPHSKGLLKLGLGHCQQNQFIDSNNLRKCLSLLMKIVFMMNSLMNLKKSICLETNLWIFYF
jgi:hypothetical protein